MRPRASWVPIRRAVPEPPLRSSPVLLPDELRYDAAEGLILRFARAYQTVTPLTIGEVWALPTMLRIALLENLSRLALQTHLIRLDRGEKP